MRFPQPSAIGPQRGMTLIEILVALTIMSLLVVGLLSTIRVAQDVDARSGRLERTVQDELIAHRFLRQIISAAYPKQGNGEARTPENGLRGDSRALDLLTTLGRGAGDRGLQRVNIRWEPLAGGGGVLVAYVNPEGSASDSSSSTYREVLVERVESVEWAYGTGEVSGWVDHWTADALPRLVRLRLRYLDGQSRLWPELVVATRITNDANCQFDVVAQGCRGQSHQWLPH